ncbi:thioredoxin family protein [Arthrobacter sp. A5]|uniref:thioredoxin family protein n=1 Tax=Arthrobacter sp. A5 TaxID=576926 RepID=UPI003DA8C279
MEITLQYFDGCPNWKVAEAGLMTLAAQRPDVVLTRQVVDTVEEAERVGFHGSPTILINGADMFAAGATVGLACRRYMTPEGAAGSPSIEQLRSAIGAG